VRGGVDYRPALLQRTGIGRYVRELVRSLASTEGAPDLALFGDSFARTRVPGARAPVAGARLYRRRIPGRLLPILARLGIGADDLVGGVDLFHYTDFIYPPVRRSPTRRRSLTPPSPPTPPSNARGQAGSPAPGPGGTAPAPRRS